MERSGFDSQHYHNFFLIFMLKDAGFTTSTSLNLKNSQIHFKKYFLGILINSDSAQLANNFLLTAKAESVTDSGNIYQITFTNNNREKVIFESATNHEMNKALSFLADKNVKFEDIRPIRSNEI